MPWPYKTVLVVGCTAGIGVALAERMVDAGSFVIAAGRRVERLEALRAKHGGDKVAVSRVDVTELGGIRAWADGIIKSYPALDCVVLNAGIQGTLDFTNPAGIDLDRVDKEVTTNYTSTIHLATAFLGHLQSVAPNPAALVFVSSALAIVPLPRCAGYCASKAAVHSLAWTMRAQLAAHEGSRHITVIDIVPPAVQTELHSLQPDLVAEGLGDIGIPLDEFADECWEGLSKVGEGQSEGTGKERRGKGEILVGPIRKGMGHIEDAKWEAFGNLRGVTGFKGKTGSSD